jgi:hypothetical protein
MTELSPEFCERMKKRENELVSKLMEDTKKVFSHSNTSERVIHHENDNDIIADNLFQRAMRLDLAMHGGIPSYNHSAYLRREGMRELYERTLEDYDKWVKGKSYPDGSRPDLHRL